MKQESKPLPRAMPQGVCAKHKMFKLLKGCFRNPFKLTKKNLEIKE